MIREYQWFVDQIGRKVDRQNVGYMTSGGLNSNNLSN